jgi:hypothetical protein
MLLIWWLSSRCAVIIIQQRHRFSLHTTLTLFQIVKLHVSPLYNDQQRLRTKTVHKRKRCIISYTLTYFLIYLFAYLLAYLFTYFLTYSMEQSHSSFLLQKLSGFHLVKKFPAFYGTRRFTSARQLSLSWASSIQSILPHPTSWRSILTLSSHLRFNVTHEDYNVSKFTVLKHTEVYFKIWLQQLLFVYVFTKNWFNSA